MPIDDEDVAQNFLCFRCVGESYFSAEIRVPSQQTPIILGLGLPMAALRIDTQSIYVHTVKRVEIRTEEHQVTRRRIAARERKF